jgi:hypothetical protein
MTAAAVRHPRQVQTQTVTLVQRTKRKNTMTQVAVRVLAQVAAVVVVRVTVNRTVPHLRRRQILRQRLNVKRARKLKKPKRRRPRPLHRVQVVRRVIQIKLLIIIEECHQSYVHLLNNPSLLKFIIESEAVYKSRHKSGHVQFKNQFILEMILCNIFSFKIIELFFKFYIIIFFFFYLLMHFCFWSS